MSTQPQSDVLASKVKCLLVDDMAENLLVLSSLLQREDVELLTATSGAEALELLLQHEVALALLDVQMPVMDGFELAELIRSNASTRDIPLIFVTAGARDQQRIFKGYDAGAVDFLFKPVEPHVLKNKAEVFFQLHRQKQQLARQLLERTETLRMNEMFTAVLSHDLRNPLSALMLSADALRLRAGDEAMRESVALIQSCAGRMNAMIEDLLDLTRARLAGGIDLKLRECDLAELFGSVIHEHQARAPGRVVEFTHKGHVLLHCDVSRIAQLVSNLIGNAFKHGAGDGPIVVELDGSGREAVRFSITNQGAISPSLLPQLFDPFRGGERSSDRSEGLGLGLFIVCQLVEAHRGQIDVQTPDQKRTVFRVSLPRLEALRAAVPAADEVPAPNIVPAPAVTGQTMRRVLIVEDNHLVAESLSILLQVSGNETRVAHDGIEALRIAEAFKPHVMLLDIGLPKMDGFEVAQTVRKQPWGKHMGLIALTGWNQKNDSELAQSAGFDRYLVKPANQDALLGLLEQWPPV